MIKRIYVKLILIFIVIFMVANAASFILAYYTTERSLLGELTDMLAGVAADSKSVYESGGSSAENIEKLHSADMISVKFYNDTDELRKYYDLSYKDLLKAENKPAVLIAKSLDRHIKLLPISIVKTGEHYIVASITPKGLFLDIRELTMKANIFSLAISSLLMLIASGFIVKPVRKLSAATEKIAKGDFSIRIRNNRSDELGQLIENFNIMAVELSGMEMLRNDFISDISHEFKTPLTSIEGYTKLLRDCKSDDERNEYIDIIMEETKRLSALSGNILLLNRIENENITLTKSSYRLDEQIRQVILFHENKWSSKQIELQLDLEEIVFEGNELLMYQVWLNLFDNAVKFSDTKGLIEVRLKKKDSETVFSITDYGKGMTAEEQKRMFEKFFTGDRSRNAEGNGLGLSIVKRIIDMHNGRIEVTSRPGEFTKLTVNL